MPSPDYRDILGGSVLVAVGGYAAAYAMLYLSMGSISRMGPGMFPAATGLLLATLGVAIVVSASLRRAPKVALPQLDFRALIAISAGIFSFAVALEPLGLVPAVVAQTLVTSRADGKLGLLGAGVLSVALSFVIVTLFKIGLGVPVTIVNIPW